MHVHEVSEKKNVVNDKLEQEDGKRMTYAQYTSRLRSVNTVELANALVGGKHKTFTRIHSKNRTTCSGLLETALNNVLLPTLFNGVNNIFQHRYT